jgi:hypothetical protein
MPAEYDRTKNAWKNEDHLRDDNVQLANKWKLRRRI